MAISDRPLWLVFLGSVVLIAVALEVGFRMGSAVGRRSENEKESHVSAVTGTVLALLAFMLAFTFGIVANRYDARKELVREQAITISTAYQRTDFLPQPDRDEAQALFRTYMDVLLDAAESLDITTISSDIVQLNEINAQLWDMGVEHASLAPESEVLALYVASLNSVGDIQEIRVAVAVQARLPDGIWFALSALVLLAMVAVGYQSAIAKSQRSWILVLLALSFATVITLIAVLDNPESGYLQVSQQPLIDVQNSMAEEPAP
ncbi:MAG TPA: hypothetical protein VD767_10720 [Thermomicrobiales bacterium]|nr:hypothetical protein [Thermomicrobiales bacterium]